MPYPDKIIFLHVPKAGGSTFHRMLERIYAQRNVFSLKVIDYEWSEEQFSDLPKEEREKVELLKGHMFFGLHNNFESNNVKYITMLREPVDRIISHYFFVKRWKKHHHHELLTKEKISLEDYALGDYSFEMDNGQVRQIAGVKDLPLGACSSKTLQIAKENIENHFLTPGITERFDESLLLFKQLIGWKEMPYYRQQNVTKNRQSKSEMPIHVLNQIRERNQYDLELYQWSFEKFEKALNNIPDTDKQLKKLKLLNKSFSFKESAKERLLKLIKD